jgi:homogentisate 1,2-dioxygenase
MGLIHGVYDAKSGGSGGFVPGGSSLHNCMTGHGPDTETFEQASEADLSAPTVLRDAMAFMFETRCVIQVSPFALDTPLRQAGYLRCWHGTKPRFRPPGGQDAR